MTDWAWLAGLLERAGGWSLHGGARGGGRRRAPTPVFRLQLTDGTVAGRVARIVGTRAHGPYRRAGKTPVWEVQVHGAAAVGWAMTLYGLLSPARRGMLRRILGVWRASPARPQAVGEIWGTARRRAEGRGASAAW